MQEPASQSLSNAARMALTDKNADAIFFMQSVLLYKEYTGNVRMSGLLPKPACQTRARAPWGRAASKNRRSRAASAEGVARHNPEVYLSDYIYIIQKNFACGSGKFQAAFGLFHAQNSLAAPKMSKNYPFLSAFRSGTVMRNAGVGKGMGWPIAKIK